MKNFILVRDALTQELIAIRKEMICSVEQSTKSNKPVRKITYIDNRTPEYVSDTMISILDELEDESKGEG